VSRLNNCAYEILYAEVKKCAGSDKAGKVQRDIVLKRLEKLRVQEGAPASEEELRQTVRDILPNFSEKVLKAAARDNRQAGVWGIIPFAGVLVAGVAGLIWVVNLPFPMIRQPVAKTAPILLLPSFISMDSHYRQAISLVEQADQLVNKATGPADIELGEVKVKEAQKHLDGLPVWFLGYQPQVYCSLFGCSWRFTLDEFQAARKDVGRMEAKVFQEKNAQNQLRGAEEAFLAAKQQYEGAKPGAEQQKAIAAWQAALDRMKEIPPATLAEKMARNQLQAAGRDFQEVVGDAAGRTRTNTLIEAAKTFAMAAAESSQNPPHTPEEWEQIAGLWEKAINQLNRVPLEDAGYIDAQKKLAEYTKNKGVAETRKKAESESAGALNRAKRLIAEWQRLAGSSNPDRGNLARQLQEIINELETVKVGTTAHSEAQDLLKFARETLKKLQST
jgi:hypothetical protein